MDEFSAVSRRLPLWALYERARSLGLAVQCSAQSWHGLAPEEADRYRIASAAEGGIWLLRTPHPEPVTELAGQRRVVDTSRRLLGFPRWSRAGVSQVREVPVADPALVRALDVGQAAYLYRGGVTYVQVSRLVGGPASLDRAPVTATDRQAADTGGAVGAGTVAAGGAAETAAAVVSAAGPASGAAGMAGVAGVTRGWRAAAKGGGRQTPALPDVSALLDAAFGPEPTRPRGPARSRRPEAARPADAADAADAARSDRAGRP